MPVFCFVFEKFENFINNGCADVNYIYTKLLTSFRSVSSVYVPDRFKSFYLDG